ncbi:hypothetical protein G7Z17_g13021 [Cylindrodendrum hubeiense]|uniref:Uncharacterized protein n=1 Tax=Cylindrodendrum hubeiense TaxID=595255 RepID=A0A9P5H1U6_9HYPO|nr:hypothetical protein G7Z17_g13021 [Cylindrodendrum hubeiense]
MMRGNRARSPEGDRRRRYDPRDPRQPPPQGPPPPAMPAYNQPPPEESRRARTPSPTFSFSSSSDSSLLDISRYKDTKQFGGILGTFFRAPSEKNRQRRRAKKKRRVLYFGNSSSSSVNSDLAYGAGYIKGTKTRSFSPQERRASQEFRRTSQEFRRTSQEFRRSSQEFSRPDAPPPLPARREREHQSARYKRDPDAEIMNLGRQLSDLARRQHEDDHRHSGRGKGLALGAAGAVGASMMASKYGRHKQDGTRGMGGSKPHRNSSDDESDWEDASEDESSSSDGADSVLAYGGGNAASHATKPAVVAVAATATAAAAAGMSTYRPSTDSPSIYRDYGEKSSVVDPRLFGPYNSLRGMINTPCGFGDLQQASSYQRSSAPITNERPIYPAPPPATTRFDASRTSISSRQDLPHHAQPAPVTLQQPIPKAPVSSKVYNAEKFEDVSRKDSRHSREQSDEKSHWGEVAAVGLAAAAIGTAVASSSSRKDEKRERRDARVEEKRDRDSRRHRDEEGYQDSKRRERDEERQLRQQEKERRKSKREPESSNYADDRDPKRSSRFDDHDDTLKKRKDKEMEVVVMPHQDLVSYKRRGEDILVEREPETRVEIRKHEPETRVEIRQA